MGLDVGDPMDPWLRNRYAGTAPVARGRAVPHGPAPAVSRSARRRADETLRALDRELRARRRRRRLLWLTFAVAVLVAAAWLVGLFG